MRALVVLAACFAATLAFDIPEPFQWDESFLVVYEKLDTQHKGLFTGIFDVCHHPSDAAVLTHLNDVIKTHFTDEEKMMKDAHYGEFDAHHKIHEDFKHDLGALHTPVSAEKCHWAKEWLVNHIKGTDFKYKGKLL